MAKLRMVENEGKCKLTFSVSLLEEEDPNMRIHTDEEAKVVEMPMKKPKKKK